MVASLEIATRSLLERETHTVITCWRIARKDGVVFRFTDHQREIKIFDNQTYSPSKAGTSSARRKQSGLEESNADYTGSITSDAITAEDLQNGKFADAEVFEFLVDWRFPWVPPVRTSRYYLGEINYTGEVWRAETTGIPTWFKQQIGRKFSRGCDEVLGGPRCKVNLTSFSDYATVDSVINLRDGFQDSSISSSFNDEDFTGGQVFWVTGDNAGTISEVKKYVKVGRIVTFFLPTSYDIGVGDEAAIYRGCKHTFSACVTDFSNGDNFQGFPTIPGPDRALRQP